VTNKRAYTLPLAVQADIEDLAGADAALALLRAEGRETARQDVAEAAAAQKPRVRAAGQGALFDFSPDAFDPE
jgi:hypothetical protein